MFDAAALDVANAMIRFERSLDALKKAEEERETARALLRIAEFDLRVAARAVAGLPPDTGDRRPLPTRSP